MVAITLENPESTKPESINTDEPMALAGMHILASALAGMAVGTAVLTLPIMLGWW